VIKFVKRLMLLAKHARRVRIPRPKVSKVQTIATNARPGKRTLTKVLLRVVIVQIVLRIQDRKLKGHLNAFHVQLVGLLETAVQNVLRVVRGRLARGVKIAHWVLQDKGTTVIRLDVNNVNWVKQQRLKVPLNARIVMLEHLAKRKVFVRNARRVSTKTPKAKQNAVKSVSPLEKYPTTNAPDVNCHRGVPAKWVNI
jgi:hypothetical protein